MGFLGIRNSSYISILLYRPASLGNQVGTTNRQPVSVAERAGQSGLLLADGCANPECVTERIDPYLQLPDAGRPNAGIWRADPKGPS